MIFKLYHNLILGFPRSWGIPKRLDGVYLMEKSKKKSEWFGGTHILGIPQILSTMFLWKELELYGYI